MGKYKVCVYAISKNEEKFVDRWVSSMSEADSIYVLDTGSSDNTVQKLRNLGVHVVSKVIEHFRFDVARNDSLNLVPEDIFLVGEMNLKKVGKVLPHELDIIIIGV